MAIDQSLNVRTWLQTITAVDSACGERIHHNVVPEVSNNIYIWYRQSGDISDYCLDDSAGEKPLATSFDIEVCGTDLDAVASVTLAIKNATPTRGAFGTYTAGLIMANSHDDSYAFENQFSDDVRHIQSLLLQVF